MIRATLPAMPWRRGVLAVLLSASCSAGALGAAPLPTADPPSTESPGDVVTLRGRVVCLDALADAPPDPEIDPCNQPGARFELRQAGGEAVRFLSDDARAGVFADPAVRERELEVRGWRREGGAFEVLSVYSMKGGVLHHIHYRCDVCNITASAPGPC